MNGAMTIGRVRGIPIRVHWTFTLLVGFVVAATLRAHGSLLVSLGWIVALFGSVTIHELSHCFVARRRGLVVNDIVLLPVGGVSEIDSMDASAAVERDVAIAGPIASVLLAVVLGAAAVLTGGHLWPIALGSGSWLTRLAWLNVILAAFNMLPALPMDGGRVFRAVLARHFGRATATRAAADVAQVVGILMIAGGIFYDLWLVIIGFFVLSGARAERRSAVVRSALEKLHVASVMAADATAVQADLTVQQVAPWLATFPGRAVPVLEGDRYVGMLALADMFGAVPWAYVGSLCDRTVPTFDAGEPILPDVTDILSTSDRDQFAVMHGGRVAGVLYRASIAQLVRQYATGRVRGRGAFGAYGAA
ncbi:MAG TPA: site-2 protease family protein [Acidimicrobiales bacterium]|nr:site-2 protease family protein [Acidimicrobiales bacterium]